MIFCFILGDDLIVYSFFKQWPSMLHQKVLSKEILPWGNFNEHLICTESCLPFYLLAIYDTRHEKTVLKVFVVVIPKEELVGWGPTNPSLGITPTTEYYL